MYQSTTLSLFI